MVEMIVSAYYGHVELGFEKRGDNIFFIHGDYEYTEDDCEVLKSDVQDCINALSCKVDFEKEVIKDRLILSRKDGKFYYQRADYEYEWDGGDLSDEEVERFIEVAKMMVA